MFERLLFGFFSSYCLKLVFCLHFIVINISIQADDEGAGVLVDEHWLMEHLQEQRPRQLWREGLEERVRARIAVDPVARRYYEAIFEQVDALLPLPALERTVTGRRLLDVSRAALKRTTFLAFAWRMSGDPAYLERLEECLVAVSRFSDWNPSHFLDVAEMALGVSLALDWAGEAIDPQVRELAEDALYEKALAVSMEADLQYVFRRPNNWNQVCNAGIVAAAVQLAEKYPKQAAKAIDRMREHLPVALEAYAPDGAYVEGAMYWNYGTSFNGVLFDILDTALGTTFDLQKAPGFLESADFVLQMKAPSGFYYNYYDCFLRSNFMGGLLWFAKETGIRLYAQPEHMLAEVNWSYGLEDVLDRLSVVELVWLLGIEPGPAKPLAENWVAGGWNPVGVLRSSFEDEDALYLAFKGGRADNAHGNMDGGAFIFELDGVRWAIDLGNQGYHELEEYFKGVGGSLWSRTQDSTRWGLLSKNNFGHSTVTIDNALHQVSGMVEIVSFDADRGVADLDMGTLFGDKVKGARRSFRLLGERSVEVRDRIEVSESTQCIRWQMTTQATLSETIDGLLMKQDGKVLALSVLSPAGLRASVTSLELPLHPMDKTLPGLKRIDLIVPAHLAEVGVVEIIVRLSGDL